MVKLLSLWFFVAMLITATNALPYGPSDDYYISEDYYYPRDAVYERQAPIDVGETVISVPG